MGCLALASSILFRLKFHALSGLPKNLSANVFSKTFVVFNPYSEQRKIIHGLLSALPIVMFFACMGLFLIVWKIFESGLMLSFFILIIGLNLITMEDAIEVYQTSKSFIESVKGGTSLGVGDLKVFQMLKKTMPRMSNYYLSLSILFVASSITLPYIWSSVLWFFTRFMGLLLEVSASTGIIAYQVAVFLFALILVIIHILVSKIKNKLLRYIVKSPTS